MTNPTIYNIDLFAEQEEQPWNLFSRLNAIVLACVNDSKAIAAHDPIILMRYILQRIFGTLQ
jgi:hypothetical protein